MQWSSLRRPFLCSEPLWRFLLSSLAPSSFLPLSPFFFFLIEQCLPCCHLFLISFLTFSFSFPSQKMSSFQNLVLVEWSYSFPGLQLALNIIPKFPFLGRAHSGTQVLQPKPPMWHYQCDELQSFQTSHLKKFITFTQNPRFFSWLLHVSYSSNLKSQSHFSICSLITP